MIFTNEKALVRRSAIAKMGSSDPMLRQWEDVWTGTGAIVVMIGKVAVEHGKMVFGMRTMSHSKVENVRQ